jgi:hypothetical protein
MLFPMVALLAGGETGRPIELLAFGMSTNQGVGAHLKEVAAIFESEFSNHTFEPLEVLKTDARGPFWSLLQPCCRRIFHG